MCSFVARVKYRAQGEAPGLLAFETKEALDARLEELLKLDAVSGVTVFTPWQSHSKVERIERADHAPPQEERK